MSKHLLKLILFLCLTFASAESRAAEPAGFVAVMHMNMMILPGTSEYLKHTIARSAEEGAKMLVIVLDTPGGMLTTSQEIIQEIFESPIPVAIYIAPTGATATSAGVFVTMAGHIAAMAPGTSIGAAHPVAGDGKDIGGDMRAKAENMTIAMVKSISAERGRNVAWAEKSVKESNSITESEALKMNVVDIVSEDIDGVLRQIAGKKVKVGHQTVDLEDYSKLPRRNYEISFKQKTINTLANPNVVALLWLAATTGISIELYTPGAVLPGVVGVICLILALAVSQIIPISQAGVLLLIIGSVMIGSELFITSGILGVGGVIAIIIGALSLVDESQAPGMGVSTMFILPTAVTLGSLMLFVAYTLARSAKRKAVTGLEGLVGQTARATAGFSSRGKVFVNGETWNAEVKQGIVEKGELVKVTGVKEGLTLEVSKQ